VEQRKTNAYLERIMFKPQWTDSGKFLPKGYEEEPTFYNFEIELPSWLEYAPEDVKNEYYRMLKGHISMFLDDCLESVRQRENLDK
jgi:hypothetical protein